MHSFQSTPNVQNALERASNGLCHTWLTDGNTRFIRSLRRLGIRLGVLLLVLPIPHGLQKHAHVHSLGFHLGNPGMLHHAPRCRAAGGLLLQTGMALVSKRSLAEAKKIRTYQHSIKNLNFSLHFSFFSGSSFNFGIGCRTI